MFSRLFRRHTEPFESTAAFKRLMQLAQRDIETNGEIKPAKPSEEKKSNVRTFQRKRA